ncbi:asparagine synthetase B family protein [Hanstruepera ponticola]|uniref:asparagine synthetase B family protein n=1 Tax=Hanstruepera ponticola TaxID=2042995 RepID=UPI00177C5496|nr:asparagine synthetase B family protein [Hanstruepera ponticola]
MNSKEQIIPGFLGIVGLGVEKYPTAEVNLKETINSSFFKLFVTHGETENQVKYFVSKNRFLWTGGLKLKEDFELDKFKPKDADHKFVCVDFHEKVIEIYTDHYSKIPLFYLSKNGTFYFSSSLELLLKATGMKSFEINNEGLLFHYNFGFTSFDHTLINGLKSLAGGKQLILKNDQLTVRSYFEFYKNLTSNTATIDTNIQTLDNYLFDSTKNVLASNKNIGIALSGGVDSGYLAQKIHECGKTFRAYTLGFKNDYNEFDRVDYLSNRLNFTTKKIILSPEDIISNYLEVSQHSSFPIGFNNSILNFIYKEAHQDGVDIMFDGDGADRLFLGMNKYLQLKKILNLYATAKNVNVHKLLAKMLKLVRHPIGSKLRFYFLKFNNNFPFYGERKLPNELIYDYEFEKLLNDIAIPEELKAFSSEKDKWLFFSFFSVYYTPTFFFHTPYELQLKHNIVSNPQFWSDKLVKLALEIPVSQKLNGRTTKMVLRKAAKLKIDDGYWNLSKIGLQNSFSYLKNSEVGKSFINEQVQQIKESDSYQYLVNAVPDKSIDAERLIPFHIWKTNMLK